MKPEELGKYGGLLGECAKSLGMNTDDFAIACLWSAVSVYALDADGKAPEEVDEIMERTHSLIDLFYARATLLIREMKHEKPN